MRLPPFDRPGIPPLTVTWADRDCLARFVDDVRALRKEADVMIASCHWGLGGEVLTSISDIAHAAVGAVMGYGPRRLPAIGFYRGWQIFYGVDSFSFHTGHLGMKHGDWIGLLVKMTGGAEPEPLSFSFVRHNDTVSAPGGRARPPSTC